MRNTLDEQGRAVTFARSHRIVLAALALVVAFVLLQVPPFDSWRYHRLASLRATPGELRADTPPFRVSPHAPVRLEWSAAAALGGRRPRTCDSKAPTRLWIAGSRDLYSGPWVVDGLQSGLVGLMSALGRGSALEGLRPNSPIYSDPLDLQPGSRHGRLLIAPWPGRHEGRPDSEWAVGYDTVVPEQPAVTVVVSQPYGYYFLPIEDYLVAGALLVCCVWAPTRYTRRWLRRRHAMFEDGGAEAADVV
jgi:hypothetical protein